MKGILRLAFKLLINDSAKFTALLVGITFAVFLMVEMTSLFAGILNKSSSTVINIGAKMRVMDPAVQTIASSIGMPDYVLDAVRSTDGVKYAVPLYARRHRDANGQGRFGSGAFGSARGRVVGAGGACGR
jgi:putative ABC transport system permease protein